VKSSFIRQSDRRTPAEDNFISTYLHTRLELSIAEGITAELPVNRDAVGLALAELKQDEGDLDGAIDVVSNSSRRPIRQSRSPSSTQRPNAGTM
jgi:hypothetical protein